MAEVWLLDTSALIAFTDAEPGAERVRALLVQAATGGVRVCASFVSLCEVQYIKTYDLDAPRAAHIVENLKAAPIEWVHSDATLCVSAAELKSQHKISFADVFVAATALRLDAVLVHKDPGFLALAPQLKQEALPLKGAAAKTT